MPLLLREGIATLINSESDMQLVAQASSGREAIQIFRERKPEVTLMDLRLPDMSGIDAMISILTEFPEARIIMLTTFERDVEIRNGRQDDLQGVDRDVLQGHVEAERLVEDLVVELPGGRTSHRRIVVSDEAEREDAPDRRHDDDDGSDLHERIDFAPDVRFQIAK